MRHPPPPGLEEARRAPRWAAPLRLESLLKKRKTQDRCQEAAGQAGGHSAPILAMGVGPPPGLERPGEVGAHPPRTPPPLARPLQAAYVQVPSLGASFSGSKARVPANTPRGDRVPRDCAPRVKVQTMGAAAPLRCAAGRPAAAAAGRPARAAPGLTAPAAGSTLPTAAAAGPAGAGPASAAPAAPPAARGGRPGAYHIRTATPQASSAAAAAGPASEAPGSAAPQPPTNAANSAGGGQCSRHLKRRLRQALCSKRLRRVVLELFAGSAHLTEALKRRGLPALALDLSHGTVEDHLSGEFHSVLRGWLAGRVAGAVWLGTPCTTWTQALRRPLRTRARPMGRADLLPHEAAKVRVGNRTFHFSCDVIELCVELGIPVFIENPAGSLIWKARRLQRLLQRPSCQLLTFDCCQYGSPWRKRTSVAAWGAADLSRLQRRCAGRRGQCSRTGRPHVILTGHSDGVHLTAQAAAYPPPFCREISKLIEHSMQFQTHRHLVDIIVK